jgi:hypothetical protein
MKKFNHDLITYLPVLERVDGEIRTYVTPEGIHYPSVTTILGKTLDKSGLDEWRNRVGDEEADRVTKRSAKRGTEVHRLCEDLILNREINLRREMPLNRMMFQQLQKVLEESVDHIRGSELFLYSDHLKVAGACDLIASYNDVKSIIDFKTSKSPKPREWIDGYFLQTALYSYMFWERTKIKHSQLVVLIAVEEGDHAQVFIENVDDWIHKAKKCSQAFHEQFTY